MQAVHTYDQASGNFHGLGVYEEELEAAREELANLYVRCGLASGPAHAGELARHVERQALQQAERHSGIGC